MKLRKAVIGSIFGILLGAMSHPPGIVFLSNTDFAIHLLLAIVGFAIGFLLDNRR